MLESSYTGSIKHNHLKTQKLSVSKKFLNTNFFKVDKKEQSNHTLKTVFLWEKRKVKRKLNKCQNKQVNFKKTSLNATCILIPCKKGRNHSCCVIYWGVLTLHQNGFLFKSVMYLYIFLFEICSNQSQVYIRSQKHGWAKK